MKTKKKILLKDKSDETEYLLHNSSNKKHLLDAIEDLNQENKISFSISEFNELCKKLSKEIL